jgi:hypothetical protein
MRLLKNNNPAANLKRLQRGMSLCYVQFRLEQFPAKNIVHNLHDNMIRKSGWQHRGLIENSIRKKEIMVGNANKQ